MDGIQCFIGQFGFLWHYCVGCALSWIKFQSYSHCSSDDRSDWRACWFLSSDALKEEAVICEQLGTRRTYDIWKIINHLWKEKKRSQDSAPGHSRCDIRLGGICPLQQDLLRSVGQEWFNPVERVFSNAIVVEFVKDTTVRHQVKRLAKIMSTGWPAPSWLAILWTVTTSWDSKEHLCQHVDCCGVPYSCQSASWWYCGQ